MKKYWINALSVLGFFSILCIACSPKVKTKLTQHYPALDFRAEVIVLGIAEETPPSAIEIGTVKIGDTGISTNCGWDVVIEKAKTEARKSGGNVLKIIEHIPPSMLGSTCDRIQAKILKIENPQDLITLRENKAPLIDSTWNYAKIFIYRPNGIGPLVGYNLYLDDSVLFRAKNNSKQEIKITKQGTHILWAKTESKTELAIDIEFGRTYYLRCGLQMGVMVGRPQLQLIDAMVGKSEFDKVK